MVRRLPVLNDKPKDAEGEEEEPRPPWHWVGFGVVAIFAAWLPLAYVAGAASSRVMASKFGGDASRDAIALAVEAMSAGERARLMATVALPNVLALALASFGGGFVVGRFGAPAGVREAVWSGLLAALLASVLAWAGVSLPALIAAAVTIVVAGGGAAWGARLGGGRRR